MAIPCSRADLVAPPPWPSSHARVSGGRSVLARRGRGDRVAGGEGLLQRLVQHVFLVLLLVPPLLRGGIVPWLALGRGQGVRLVVGSGGHDPAPVALKARS